MHISIFRALLFAEDVNKHLVQICEQEALDKNENPDCPAKKPKMCTIPMDEVNEAILKCFVECLPRNRAVKRDRTNYSLAHDRGVDLCAKLHPSSSLVSMKPSIILFCDLTENADRTLHMIHCSYVDPTWL